MLGLRLFYFFFFAALGIYSPAFPRWLEANGIRGFELGVVAALGPVMGLVSPPVFGWLADKSGLRRSLVASTALVSACVGGSLGLVSARAAPAFAVTLGCAAGFAFFRAPMGSLADTIALESRVSYGPVRLWGSLGFVVAAVAAGRWIDPTSPVLLASIAAALGCAALAAWLLPARSPVLAASVGVARTRMGALALLRDAPALRWLFLCALFFETAHSAYDLCFSLHLRDEGIAPAMAGILWALGVMAEVVFFLVAERLLERFGPGSLLVLGAAATAVRLGLMGELHGLASLAALQSLHALTFGATWTALMRIVREQARPESLGALRGLLSATSAVGGASGMIAWGTCYRALGGATTFRGAALVGSVAAVLGAICARSLAALEGQDVPGVASGK